MRSVPGDQEEFKEGDRRNNDRSFREDFTDRSVVQNNNYNSFKAPKNAEEAVVPALGMKKPIDFNTVDDNDFNTGANVNDVDEELKL